MKALQKLNGLIITIALLTCGTLGGWHLRGFYTSTVEPATKAVNTVQTVGNWLGGKDGR